MVFIWINSYHKLNLNNKLFNFRKFVNIYLFLGLYEEYLFDETYSANGRKANIISAYELVSGSRKSCKTIVDFDAVDVASVLVMWLYYLPEPLISSKQFSMICGNIFIYNFYYKDHVSHSVVKT
jgi:hypothetical protein